MYNPILAGILANAFVPKKKQSPVGELLEVGVEAATNYIVCRKNHTLEPQSDPNEDHRSLQLLKLCNTLDGLGVGMLSFPRAGTMYLPVTRSGLAYYFTPPDMKF